MDKPSYYGILPANVRYADISPQAKILYTELTVLTQKDGYCFANNLYFANLYDTSVETISRYISELKNNNFIRCEYSKKTGSEKSERKIYIVGIDENINRGIDKNEGIDKNINTGIDEIVKGGIDENVKHNNTSINTTSNNNLKESKKERKQSENEDNRTYNQIIDENVKDNNELNSVLKEWVKSRLIKKDKFTNYAIELAIKKVLKFPLEKQIPSVEESIIRGWSGIFEIKNDIKDKAREAYIKDVEYKINHKSNSEKSEEAYNSLIDKLNKGKINPEEDVGFANLWEVEDDSSGIKAIEQKLETNDSNYTRS